MATVPSPSLFAVRMILHAISPRLAMRIFWNIRRPPALLRRRGAAPEAIFAYLLAHSPERIFWCCGGLGAAAHGMAQRTAIGSTINFRASAPAYPYRRGFPRRCPARQVLRAR